MFTLNEAKEEFEKCLNKGTFCPCCERYARRYRRSIYKPMAEGLRYLHESREAYCDEFDRDPVDGCGRGWMSTKEVSKQWGTGDLKKLRFWGLIKVDAAFVKITEKGIAFVEGQTVIPKYVYTYNNKVCGFSHEEEVSFQDCFDPAEFKMNDTKTGGNE